MAKFKFRSRGNVTIGLRSSYEDVVYNDAGKPIMTKKVAAVRAVFNGGFFETDDEDIVKMLQEKPDWGNDVFWDPTSLPKESPPEDKETAKVIADADLSRKKRRKRGIENAKEGSVAKEQ